MVKTLHQANIEVYMEINFTKKISQDQMLEILRYWVIMYHIDGFRIDTSILFDELAARDPVLGKTKLFSAGCLDMKQKTPLEQNKNSFPHIPNN